MEDRKDEIIMGTIDKIFDNFEALYEDYTDMPKTCEKRNETFSYLEEKGIDMDDVGNYILSLISEYERQGFLYGFRYAVMIFLDGALRYE